MVELLSRKPGLRRSPRSSSLTGKAEVRGRADIALLLDITASMSEFIQQLKGNLAGLIKNVLESVTKDYGVVRPEMRFAIMGFRDLEDDPIKGIVIPKLQFSSMQSDLVEFLGSTAMKAEGGELHVGESALDAIYRALDRLEWDRPVKLIFLFTDSTPKKSLHSSSLEGKASGAVESMELLSRKIIESKARVIIFGPAGVEEFRKIGTLDYCRYIELEVANGDIPAFSNSDLFREKVLEVLGALIPKESITPT